MTELIQEQNAEYQRSLKEQISVLTEQQKQLAELNEQQARELQSLRQRQQHMPSTTGAGENLMHLYIVSKIEPWSHSRHR